MLKPYHPPTPPAVASATGTAKSIQTSVFEALLELRDDPKPRREPLGVLPILDQGAALPSMSLGTARLCNDQGSPVPDTDFSRAISGADGTTPIACIEWQRVTFYREQIKSKSSNYTQLIKEANLTRGQFNGYMSPATRRKVRKSVSTWIRSIMLYRAEVKRRYDPGRAYPVFLTLTLPTAQTHTDAEINRACLQPFLTRLKRDYEIENYFWRAEAQENGNLHYHLLVDRYIPKRYLQLAWNLSIEALGYLTKYFEESGSLTPPSTEVHRIRDKVKDRKTGKWKQIDPVDYLLDYVMDTPQPEPDDPSATNEAGPGAPVDPNAPPPPKKLIGRYRKSDGTIDTYITRPITGRVWGMSDTLRDIREPRAEATVGMVTALEEAKNKGLLRRVDLEYATMYFGPVGLVLARASRAHWALIKDYYLQVFGHLYPKQLPPDYLRDHPPHDPRNLWLDFESTAFYHRLQLESDSPAFETAADLDNWVAQQAARSSRSSAAA